ncbi:MAG: MnmC family methyltransferase, partial [Bacteroidota bacterium]
EQFKFTKYLKRFEALDYDNQFDIIYFDAFAPNSQPELWEAEVIGAMYNALKPDGVLTTYCAKGDVKRTMKAVGFEVEKLKGPPGKREMTRATKVSS